MISVLNARWPAKEEGDRAVFGAGGRERQGEPASPRDKLPQAETPQPLTRRSPERLPATHRVPAPDTARIGPPPAAPSSRAA